jgi:hypothetical protein
MMVRFGRQRPHVQRIVETRVLREEEPSEPPAADSRDKPGDLDDEA